MEDEKLPPNIVLSFWAAQRPGIEPETWECLNEEYENSDKWGYIIYKIYSYKCKPLYAALQVNNEQLIIRELSTDEIEFLKTGKIPDA